MAIQTRIHVSHGLWSVALLTSALSGKALHVDNDGELIDCSWNQVQRDQFDQGGSRSDEVLERWPCNPEPRWNNKRPTILCIGDSMTHGARVHRKETYPAILHELLEKRFNVLNLGVGGATMQDLSNQSYRALPHWKLALESKRIALTIIQLGTNDAMAANWNATRYKQDYMKLLRDLRKAHHKKEILVSVPPTVLKSTSQARKRGLLSKDIVDNDIPGLIRSAQAEAGLKFEAVDMQAAFKQDGHRMEELYLLDNVHPSPAGYTVMAAALANAANAALQSSLF